MMAIEKWGVLERELERLEPDTAPSDRMNRVVRVGSAHVLELRDPNDGAGARHQYAVSTGCLWHRRLPPESSGDEWLDPPGPVPWQLCELSELAVGALRTFARQAPRATTAVLRRLQSYAEDDSVWFRIRGERIAWNDASDVFVCFGPITGAWWDVPLPSCPDCEGELVWAEAGLVPGARACRGCGSLYTVTSW